MEENIEDRIKTIISNKMNNNKFKNGLDKEKVDIIEKIFEIFPDLKDEKQYILNDYKRKNQIHNDNANEIILEEFIFNEKTYYTDKFNNIWDESAELIGVRKGDNCLFFNDTIDSLGDINKFME